MEHEPTYSLHLTRGEIESLRDFANAGHREWGDHEDVELQSALAKLEEVLATQKAMISWVCRTHGVIARYVEGFEPWARTCWAPVTPDDLCGEPLQAIQVVS